MFVIEAVPAVVLGIISLFWLTDEPRKAGWLSPNEREVLAATVERHGSTAKLVGIKDALFNPYLWSLTHALRIRRSLPQPQSINNLRTPRSVYVREQQ
jgi:sugar phosphate permease